MVAGDDEPDSGAARGVVTQRFERLPPVSVEEVRDRACAYLADHPDLLEYEKRDGVLISPEEFMAEHLVHVRARRSIAGLCHVLGDGWTYY